MENILLKILKCLTCGSVLTLLILTMLTISFDIKNRQTYWITNICVLSFGGLIVLVLAIVIKNSKNTEQEPLITYPAYDNL